MDVRPRLAAPAKGVAAVISLAAGTVLDASPAQVLESAAAAGYDAAGLRLDPKATSLAEAARLRRRADSCGLQVLDLEVVRLRPDRDMGQHHAMLDLADTLGARFLLTVSEHQDASATVSELAQLYDTSHNYATRIALEFMRFTGVPTLAAALDMLDMAQAVEAVVLVDALHLHRAGERPEDLIRVPSGRIGYLQICDAPSQAPQGLEALAWEARHDRLAPGEGDLPLGELLAHVGPAVPLSIEVQSDRLAAVWEPTSRATHLLTRTQPLLASRYGRPRPTI